MFNMLKMDLRRLFKSRNFYIILGVTTVLVLMVAMLTDWLRFSLVMSDGLIPHLFIR